MQNEENKIIENENIFDVQDNIVAEDNKSNDEIEKTSYNKSSYRAVRRIREKGVEYGVNVPYLKNPLSEDRSSGLALKILLVITACLIAVGLGLFIWGMAGIIAPFSKIVGDFSGSSTEIAETAKNIPILGSFAALSMAVVWTVIIGLPIITFSIMVICAVYLLSLFRIYNLTMEEKAVGYYVTKVKRFSLFIAIIFAIMAVLFFAWAKIIALGIITIIIAVYFAGLFVALQLERNRAKANFDTLPQEQQDDFINHSNALKAANSHSYARKMIGNSSFGKHGKLELLFRLMYGFSDAKIVYKNLKNNPDFKETSTGLARRALWQLLNFVISTGIIMLFSYFFLSLFGDVVIFKIILILLTAVLAIYSFLLVLPLTLSYTIRQLKLNKKPLGWVALGLTILVVVLVVISLFLLFTKL